jgi:hypothetical protein
MLVQQLARAFAPWQSMYSNSTAVSTTVTAAHLLALMFGGGLAVAADRATLRVGRTAYDQQAHQLGELKAVHPPVLAALVVLFVTGALLAAADFETFVTSPLFWLKLGLVALLVVNGIVLSGTESALRREYNAGDGALERTPRLWRRLRVNARLSLALWTATLVAGAVLTNAA